MFLIYRYRISVNDKYSSSQFLKGVSNQLVICIKLLALSIHILLFSGFYRSSRGRFCTISPQRERETIRETRFRRRGENSSSFSGKFEEWKKRWALLAATTCNLQFGGYETATPFHERATQPLVEPTSFASSGKCGGNYAIIALRPTIVTENGESAWMAWVSKG